MTRSRGFNLSLLKRERRNSIHSFNFQVNRYSCDKLHPELNTSSVSVTLNHIQLAFKQRSEGDIQGTFQAPAVSNSASWKEPCWTVGQFSEDGPPDASQKTICFDLQGHLHSHENLWVPPPPTMVSVSTESFPKLSSCCRETMRHLNLLWRAVLPSRTGSFILLLLFLFNRNSISNNSSPLIGTVALLHRTGSWLVQVSDLSDYRLSVKWGTMLWNNVISKAASR